MSLHAFEPELLQPVPRRVRRKGGFLSWCLLIVVSAALTPLAALGLVMTCLFLTLSAAVVERQFGAAEAAGVVTSKAVTLKGAHEMTVEFPHRGTARMATLRLSAEQYQGVRVGDEVTVHFSSVLPTSTATIESGPGLLRTIGVELAVSALFAAGFVSAIRGTHFNVWRVRQLIRRGEAVAATVTRVKSSGFSRRGGHAALRYEFRAPWSGRTYGGEYVRPLFPKSALGVGDTLTVLFDPRRPRRHVVYEDADYAAVFR